MKAILVIEFDDEWLEYSERIGYNACINELLGEEE